MRSGRPDLFVEHCGDFTLVIDREVGVAHRLDGEFVAVADEVADLACGERVLVNLAGMGAALAGVLKRKGLKVLGVRLIPA